MNRDEAKKFLDSQRSVKKKVMDKMSQAIDAFNEQDELGVNLLGPRDDLEKQRVLKEFKNGGNEQE